jgi:hypothetical protein
LRLLMIQSVPAAQDVVILGAGFSRAFHEEFPLADELGNEIVEKLTNTSTPPHLDVPKSFKDGSFEVWLSRLAEPQPYQSGVQNAEAQALFHKVSSQINEVMVARQGKALSASPAEWFWRFLSLLQVRLASVVTFNYDNVIEWGVTQHHLSSLGTSGAGQIDVENVLGGLPHLPSPLLMTTFKPSILESFRLFKLHGSLTWYWSPGDETGATLQRLQPPDIDYGDLASLDETRRRSLPGREPFLVPPSTLKSAYFRNPVTREIWSSAYEALRLAKRWIIVGYSLPLTDLTVRNMLTQALQGRDLGDLLEVWVVNRSCEEVVVRLGALGLPHSQIRSIEGITSVAEFVDELEREQAQAVVEQLGKEALPEINILVTWGVDSSKYQVDTITPDSACADALVLNLRGPGQITWGTDKRHELTQGLRDKRRLTAQFPSGERRSIVQFDIPNQRPDSLSWLTLWPAGKPPNEKASSRGLQQE